MQKAISFGASAIAQYIYQNNTSAIKERPQEIHFFSIFLDTQLNKNYSKILSRHGTELWMPDFYIILFSGPSVMLTTDSKKWQIFRPICVLMKFDHMCHSSVGIPGKFHSLEKASLAHSMVWLTGVFSLRRPSEWRDSLVWTKQIRVENCPRV